jgi:GNAT superfamily N-acetyltransferase
MEIRTPSSHAEWEQYYDLRYRILRAPWHQPRGSERNDADAFAIHLAYFEQGRILGVVRLDTQESDLWAQVRFMAVEENQQGKGIGKKLMQEAENYAKRLGFKRMMLQARAIALPFYKSLEYDIMEKSHLLFGEIQHYKMEKTLKD